jgi:orotidine-5'-phosphate decarboxylase
MPGRKAGLRGRPPKEATMDTLAVRLPDDLVRQVDEYVALLKEGMPLLNITRADALRQLIASGLAVERKKLAKRQ